MPEVQNKIMKEIKLLPDAPFHNYVEIAVMDFPKGRNEQPRTRCKVTADFAEFDVNQLKQRGLDYEGAIKYYEEWLYEIIKVNLAQDWTCVEGWEQVMDIIKEKVAGYYE